MTDTDRVYCQETPGFYAVRLAKRGVEVACEVAHGPSVDPDTGEPLDRSWWWTIRFEGEDPPSYSSPAIYPQLLIGRPIDGVEYAYLVERGAWARRYRPQSPEARPRAAANLQTVDRFF